MFRYAIILFLPLTATVLSTPVPVLAEVYAYECDSLPPEAGWTLLQAWCDPQEWVNDGHHFQHVELCEGYDPPQGQRFDYTRSLADFLGQGENGFFIEWVNQTDGHRDEIPYTAPAMLSAYNNGSVWYKATIASDRVRLFRDTDLPILYFDIEEGMSHRYRLELYGETLYRWFIDDVEVDAGVPEGELLAYSPAVNTCAAAKFAASTTIWDCIRWGTIPADGSGDYDSDGAVDSDDFYFFQDYFSGADVDAGPGGRWADFDADTDVDCDDWEAFQLAWTDPADPPIFFTCFTDPIPTVSEWGFAIMALLVLAAGTIAFRR